MGYDYGWRPYVPVWQRVARAEKEVAKLKKQGHPVAPVVVEGRTIARTFWGKAWCENLERYSDYANRLPRGRSYLRNGLIVDLQVAEGEVSALVSGSALYRVSIAIKEVGKPHWQAVCRDCAGSIASLVELLGGKLSDQVMSRICEPRSGLFPAPAEIRLKCSCPDWATMCKHVAAVLYGIGARLDERPELLFKLRGVDERELIAQAGAGVARLGTAAPAANQLDEGGLEELFGIEIAAEIPEPAGNGRPARKATASAAKKANVPAAKKANVPAAKKANAPAAKKANAPAAKKANAPAAKKASRPVDEAARLAKEEARAEAIRRIREIAEAEAAEIVRSRAEASTPRP